MENEMTFTEGELVGVPCTIQLGPFPDERLVTVESREGLLSGFVKQQNLRVTDDEDHGLVKGLVIKIAGDSVTVQLFGSFFTTALGMAFVQRNGLKRIAA
jgi:hypothetical protein